MAAPEAPIAIASSTRKTRLRTASLRSTSPIHARRPSSDIGVTLIHYPAARTSPPSPKEIFRMPDAVIVDTARTPIGRAFKGSLAQLRPDETGAYVIDQLLERNPDVDPASVEDVFCGCGMPQGLQAFNVARIMVLLSEKLPETVNGVTMSRYCASSLDSIRHAANAVRAGQGDTYVAAGIEWVSRYNERTEPAG